MAGFVESSAIIIDPLFTLWQSFKNVLPGIVGAIIVLIIGYLVALIIGHAVKIILEKLGLDAKVRKAKLTKTMGHTHLPAIFGEITKWYIFIIFLQVAVDLLNLGTLTSLLHVFVLWLPNLIAAILVVLFGLALGHYVEIKMREHTRMKGMIVASKITKVLIVILMTIVAAEQINLSFGIVRESFLIIIAAFALGIALALGIGLGLGMKGSCEKVLKDFKKYF